MINKNRNRFILIISLCLFSHTGCAILGSNNATSATIEKNITDQTKEIPVTDKTFNCLKKLHPVRGFFVDNILGNLDATIQAANSENGAVFPAGSLVQLIPEEVMIKHNKGWSPKTNDWEFIELDVTEEGSKIKVRGTTQVINKFGGNCFECHQQAEPQWDLICEQSHGCEPLPIPDFLIHWTQNSDPRCD